MVYDIGKWTPSTALALLFVKQQNDSGIKPKLRDIKNGTIRNWIYALKKAGYIQNGEGFALTPKGIDLLNELQHNPPVDKRGRQRNYRRDTNIVPSSNAPTNPVYEIIIRGPDLVYQALITKEEARQIIRSASEIKDKK